MSGPRQHHEIDEVEAGGLEVRSFAVSAWAPMCLQVCHVASVMVRFQRKFGLPLGDGDLIRWKFPASSQE